MVNQRSGSNERGYTPPPDGPILVWWPEERERLAELRDQGRPRLILVQEGAEPPISSDPLEEWVRSGDSASLPDRITTLMARAKPFMPGLSLDDSGILRVGEAWTSLSEHELPMAQRLVGAFGSVVTYEAMSEETGHASRASSATMDLRQRVARLRNRVRRVGLDIRAVRGRGYMLVRLPRLGAVRPSFA